MIANTYLEIYTMMFGWNMYEAIWDVLVGTGVALIPFIVAVVSTFKENYSGGNAGETIKSMETTLLGMILVLMLCVIPYNGMATTLSGVRYEVTVQDCGTASNTNTPSSTASGTGDNTQTGFDSTMSDLQTWQVHKPVAWTLIETVSTAITHTSIKSMTCVNNYEFMLMRISNITIQDETLRKDIQNFYEACYKPAVNKYKTNPPVDINGNPIVLTNVAPWKTSTGWAAAFCWVIPMPTTETKSFTFRIMRTKGSPGSRRGESRTQLTKQGSIPTVKKYGLAKGMLRDGSAMAAMV